jgi:ribosomal protein L12E/L44/L45/RPP1/RPP2
MSHTMKISQVLQATIVGTSALCVAPSFAAALAQAPSTDAHALCDGEKHEEAEKSDAKKTEKAEKKQDQKSSKKTPATT